MSAPVWTRSSACSETGCVEAALVGDRVHVRDSKIKDSPVLSWPVEAWAPLIRLIKVGALGNGLWNDCEDQGIHFTEDDKAKFRAGVLACEFDLDRLAVSS